MKDGTGYVTDIHELTNKVVDARMRPFIDVMMHEHQETRDEVKDLKKVVCQTRVWNANDVIQYAAILLLFLAMLFLPTCA